MNRLFLLALCGIVLLAGCAGNARPPSMFLLDDDDSAAPDQESRVASPVLVIDAVTVAPYLDESSIVYQTQPHRVVLANNNRWASPLSIQLTDDLYSTLQRTLRNASVQRASRRSPASALHLITRVEEFMGHYDGYAHIAGQWQLVDANGTRLAANRFDQRVPLADDGYDALVDSLSRGWQMTTQAMTPAVSGVIPTH